MLLLALLACGPGEVQTPVEQPECEPTLGGVEWCDGLDNDCNGLVDEEALDAVVWYLDQDGDGWGVEAQSMPVCEAPEGYAGRTGDCDNTEALVNPGMQEICEDGLDNDCDGSAGACGLGGDLSQGGADATLWGIDAGDRAGLVVARAGDVNLDGLDDFLVSAPFRDGNGESSGEVVLVTQVVEGEQTLWAAGTPISGGHRDLWFAETLVGPGDVDGDGWPDLVLDDLVFLGPIEGGRTTWEADFELEVTGGGDVDGDGQVDLFSPCGIYLGPVGPEHELDVLVEGGAVSAVAPDQDGDGVAEVLVGTPEGRVLNGDGYGDLIVAAPMEDSAGLDAGMAYLIPGPIQGQSTVQEAAVARIKGEKRGDEAGRQVDGTGDIDADGFADVLVAAPYEDGLGDQTGAVYLLYGPLSGMEDLYRADFVLRGTVEGGRAGESMVCAGDVDGDGFDDVLVGAKRSQQDHTAYGAALLFKGGVGW